MGLLRNIRMALEPPFTRLGLAVLPRLPRRAILMLARGLGSAAYWFSARNRRVGMANLDLAFGAEKTSAEKKRILRASLRSFALTTLDLFWFTRRPEERMARWVAATPALQAALARPGPFLLVTGHFGNWELLGRYWALHGAPVMSVAMPLKNPAMDGFLQQARQITGQQVIPREGALKKLVRHLRTGGAAGLLLDQNTSPAQGGVFADFFDKPVAVSPAAGALAALSGAVILFAYVLPRPDGSYLGDLPHEIPAAEIAALPRGAAEQELTQRITSFYEEAIRARPDCWLWSYKRWRHVPPGMSPAGFPFYAK